VSPTAYVFTGVNVPAGADLSEVKPAAFGQASPLPRAGTFTVTGLTPGTAYTFTVTATTMYGTSAPSAPSAPVMPRLEYVVGEIGPGGGTVFYVAPNPFTCGPTLASTCTYLEAAPADAAASIWCSNIYSLIPGTFRTAIGTGYSNTMLIVNGGCPAGAAATARATSSGGKNDWYLPSSSELTVLLTATVTDLIKIAGYKQYWSSLQADKSGACYQDQYSRNYPNAWNAFKTSSKSVRPIRAF